MTTKRELRLALNAIIATTKTEREAVATLSAHIDSLPPDPFVLPPPGTEFTVRLLDGERSFYRMKTGQVLEVYPKVASISFSSISFSERWFQDRNAEIVEKST